MKVGGIGAAIKLSSMTLTRTHKRRDFCTSMDATGWQSCQDKKNPSPEGKDLNIDVLTKAYFA